MALGNTKAGVNKPRRHLTVTSTWQSRRWVLHLPGTPGSASQFNSMIPGSLPLQLGSSAEGLPRFCQKDRESVLQRACTSWDQLFFLSQTGSNFHLRFLSASAVKCATSTAHSLELLFNALGAPSPTCRSPQIQNPSFWNSQRTHEYHKDVSQRLPSPAPRPVDTRRTFARKRPVIGFAGRTTSEINVLCTIIYLPWVCVFLSQVPLPLIAHSSHPGCHRGD